MDTWKNEHDACGIGAVVNINGKAENRILSDALSIVEKLEHRAGKDASGKVGDGVGILIQICHDFFLKAAKISGISLKEAGDYGIGMFFLPQNPMKRMFAKIGCEVVYLRRERFGSLTLDSMHPGEARKLTEKERMLI